jgi:hypothetical protein
VELAKKWKVENISFTEIQKWTGFSINEIEQL